MFADNRRVKLLTLGAMCFALFMAMLDNTVINVALPKIQAHFSSGVSGLQWIIDAYTLLFAMVAGLTFAGSSLLLMTRVDAGDPYATIWPLLMLMGLGMGLVMSPMTVAVMSSVPLRRAGMASATSSTSREVGGVFGIALLEAIVTHWFSKGLSPQLANLPIPAQAKAQVIAAASRGGQEATGSLQLDPSRTQALHNIIDQAFVHGMHIGLTVAGLTVLGGAVIALVFVRRPVPASVVETPSAVEPHVATVCDTA